MNTADYRTIEMALHACDDKMLEHSGVDALQERHPGSKIAARLGLSGDQLDDLFERWAGVGMIRFMQGLSVSRTRKRLVETRGLLAGLLRPGTAGTGRHGFRVWCQVRTLPPGQGRGQGTGRRGAAKTPELTIRYGLYPSPFGDCLVAMTGREICHLSFVDEGKWQSHLEELRHEWPQAIIMVDEGEGVRNRVEQIFAPAGADSAEPLLLLLKGTTFQLRVWQALLTLPRGALISYQGLATHMGSYRLSGRSRRGCRQSGELPDPLSSGDPENRGDP